MKKSSPLNLVAAAGSIFFLFVLKVLSQEDPWTRDTVEGIDYQVALNRVVRAPVGDRLEIFLFVESKSFNPENVRKIFVNLAQRYEKPRWLDIELFSDKEALRVSMKLETAPVIIDFVDTPEGRAAQAKWHERFGKLPEKYLQASYFRIERSYYSKTYIQEDYFYTPTAESRERIKVPLQTKPPIPYSGNLNKDIVIAVKENDLRKVGELLVEGATPNSVDKGGDSILMVAALSVRDLRLVQLLVNAGVFPLKTSSQ